MDWIGLVGFINSCDLSWIFGNCNTTYSRKRIRHYFSILKIDSDILLHYSPTPIANYKFIAKIVLLKLNCQNCIYKIEFPNLFCKNYIAKITFLKLLYENCINKIALLKIASPKSYQNVFHVFFFRTLSHLTEIWERGSLIWRSTLKDPNWNRFPNGSLPESSTTSGKSESRFTRRKISSLKSR